MKTIFTSKTVYLGLLVALIPFLQTLQSLPMDNQTASIVSGILGILVVINRFYTSTAISVTTPNGEIGSN